MSFLSEWPYSSSAASYISERNERFKNGRGQTPQHKKDRCFERRVTVSPCLNDRAVPGNGAVCHLRILPPKVTSSLIPHIIPAQCEFLCSCALNRAQHVRLDVEPSRHLFYRNVFYVQLLELTVPI